MSDATANRNPLKPEWMRKHPCSGCETGYLECAQGWTMWLQCCANCDHPTQRGSAEPFTAEEIADMWARRRAREQHA
jgi:hypothetical protein